VRYSFALMTLEQARVVSAWRYDPPYDFYNPSADPDDLQELLNRDAPYYAATDERGDLVGFFCFRSAAQTLGGLLSGAYADPDALDVGLGMRPDLTGRGLGAGFIEAGLAFARATFHPASFRLSVATFNRRAILAYERAGFRAGQTFMSHTSSGLHEFMAMTRPASSSVGE